MAQEQDDEQLRLLGESVDEACAPVVDEVWQQVLPGMRAALEQSEAREAARCRPTPEEIIERMRLNGLGDPDPA